MCCDAEAGSYFDSCITLRLKDLLGTVTRVRKKNNKYCRTSFLPLLLDPTTRADASSPRCRTCTEQCQNHFPPWSRVGDKSQLNRPQMPHRSEGKSQLNRPQMPPLRGGICAGVDHRTIHLPLSRLQGGLQKQEAIPRRAPIQSS